jgi:hypothetical protein
LETQQRPEGTTSSYFARHLVGDQALGKGDWLGAKLGNERPRLLRFMNGNDIVYQTRIAPTIANKPVTANIQWAKLEDSARLRRASGADRIDDQA